MDSVYALRHDKEDLFKIGRTRGVQTRIQDLATGNPHRLTLFDSIETDDACAVERFLLRSLESKRVGNGGGRDFFAATPEEIRRAFNDARLYLEHDLPRKRQVAALAAKESDGELLVEPDEHERQLHRELVAARQEKFLAEVRYELLENELKLLIGTSPGFHGVATWMTHTKTRFDEQSFKVAEPRLYEKFRHPFRQRTFRIL